MSATVEARPTDLPLVTAAPPAKRPRLFQGRSVIGVVTTVIVVWLVVVPLLFLLFTSFRDTRSGLPFEARTPFTLRNYEIVFSSIQTYRILGVTAMFAVGAVLVALVIVVTFAYLLERTDLRFRGAILTMLLAPMALPPFVAGMAWVLLANPRTGVINTALRGIFNLEGEGPINIYTFPGMIVVAGLMFVPSMYLMVSGTFGRMDPALEEASRVSGASRWTTIFRVTLPVLLPGIAAATIYFLVGGFEIFEIPALLGLPERRYTLSTFTVYFLKDPSSQLPNYGQASAYGVLTLAAVGVLLLIYWRVIQRRRNQFGTISGRGFRRQVVELGRWNYVALAGAALYSIVAFVLPLLILGWRSLLPQFAQMTDFGAANFDLYRRMFESSSIRTSALHSLEISTATAILGMTLSTVVAWLAVRARSRWSELADQLTFLSMGLPGAIIAIAILLVYLWVPLPIYGSIWIIIIGLTTRYLAFGVRVMSAALVQIKSELEEASWTSGVGHIRTLFKVVLPLVRPAANRGFLWMFVHAFRDATIAIVVASAANGTLATQIWLTWFEAGNLSYAAALSMPIALVSIVITIVIARQYRPAKAEKGTHSKIDDSLTSIAGGVSP